MGDGGLHAVAAAADERFEALDSLRGVCALLVCLFHVKAYSHLRGVDFIENAWLFVDFFFVLSGFIIAHKYDGRIRDGAAFVRFLALRIGRLYPLHLFMLALFVATEFAIAVYADAVGGVSREVFTGGRAPEAILTHLALLHSFGLHAPLTWNGPSWSISGEFYAYVAFALALMAGERTLRLAGVAIAAGVPAWILLVHDGSLAVEQDGGVLRCLYGFAAGVLVCRLRRGRPRSAARTRRLARAEAPAALLVVAFVALAGGTPASLLAPAVFGLCVWIFAEDAGPLSRALRLRPFVALGVLSYSIYMIHVYVIARIENLGVVVERASGATLFARPDGRPLLGTTPLEGDLATLLILAVTISCSVLTYRYVEEPGRRWARRLIERRAAAA